MLNSPHFAVPPQSLNWEDTSETTCTDHWLSHHEVEQSIWRELQSIPRVRFSSLTVRRVPDGVCLQGVMEADGKESAPDICGLVRRVAQLQTVVNHLLVRDCPEVGRIPR